MAKAIRGHNLGAMMTIALLAALLLLAAAAFAVQMVMTRGGSLERLAISADLDGGSSLTRDPYIDHHAEIVNRYLNSADRGGGSSLAREPALAHHAEIVDPPQPGQRSLASYR